MSLLTLHWLKHLGIWFQTCYTSRSLKWQQVFQHVRVDAGHALKYKDSHFKINKLSQGILSRYAESLCAVSPSFPSFSFDLSDPRWTRQQTPLVTMSVVHPVDSQWKVLVTLCHPISELKLIWTFYNLIDQVSYLASTGLSIVPYNGKDQQHRKEHKNKDGFQPAKNKQI